MNALSPLPLLPRFPGTSLREDRAVEAASRLGLHGAAQEAERLAATIQAIADDLAAASSRLDLHANDCTGDAALTDPSEAVVCFTPIRGLLAHLAPWATALREASR